MYLCGFISIRYSASCSFPFDDDDEDSCCCCCCCVGFSSCCTCGFCWLVAVNSMLFLFVVVVRFVSSMSSDFSSLFNAVSRSSSSSIILVLDFSSFDFRPFVSRSREFVRFITLVCVISGVVVVACLFIP